MYYSHQCTYCKKVFFTFNDDKWQAAKVLYKVIKEHLAHYDEDRREFELDDGEEKDQEQIYEEIVASNEAPSGGYENN